MRTLWALLALALLAGCGFQLRGAPQYQQLESLTLLGGSFDLHDGLINALEASDVLVHDASPHTLQIGSERIDRRTVAVDSQGRAAEIELRYTFTWQLLDSRTQSAITPRRRITLVRSFNYDPENATASSDEELYTRADMHRDATWQLLRQLDAAVRALAIGAPADQGPAQSPPLETEQP